jgi:hypothetical protein
MNKVLRLGGWALLGLVLLWATIEILGIVFGVVSWLVSTFVSVLVVAGLLYLAYLLVSKFFGESGGGQSRSQSQPREREKIFE